ncbi:MAG TPA: rhomboid family intramembrane serine protease [Bacteroidetes bacterium]|nr:rhomboid family intramembrane serine protease [Bacteroidota bacterium]
MKKERQELMSALFLPILLVGLMWLAFLAELSGNFDWARYGVQPLHWRGLRGILFSPFLHGDWEHLIANSIPILVLGTALFYFFRKIAWELIFWQFLINGLLLWTLGRPTTYHIGASGLVYSLAFFLLVSGFVRKNGGLTMISFIVITLYGSLVWGMFPVQPGVSWEGHFAGFLSGIILALFFRKEGPQDDPKKVWDDSDLDGVEPYWEVEDERIDEKAKPIGYRFHFIPKSKNTEED